ncbi:MAG: CbtA family protein [Hyphomicrobiaceae bacterium]
MLNRMLAACLAAGILAGAATAVLQEFTTTPLIIQAEAYEMPAAAGVEKSSSHFDSWHGARLIHVDASHGAGDADAWAPSAGVERTFYTSISTIATGFGFALMLLSAMIIAGARITARSGLAWGAAAFVATGLAPALGLSPELPGSAAAELVARQSWWLGTVIATAGGLFLALRLSTPLTIAAGIALICLPHIVGAPHPVEFTSKVPSELSGHFSSASLVVHAVMWALVGSVAGYVWQHGEDETIAA